MPIARTAHARAFLMHECCVAEALAGLCPRRTHRAAVFTRILAFGRLLLLLRWRRRGGGLLRVCRLCCWAWARHRWPLWRWQLRLLRARAARALALQAHEVRVEHALALATPVFTVTREVDAPGLDDHRNVFAQNLENLQTGVVRDMLAAPIWHFGLERVRQVDLVLDNLKRFEREDWFDVCAVDPIELHLCVELVPDLQLDSQVLPHLLLEALLIIRLQHAHRPPQPLALQLQEEEWARVEYPRTRGKYRPRQVK
mmetsp:Transcript_21256/g.46333  ORF Transcript_21256/g.46333 Transcript_21256/m.46333 type:complete len:256 (+) Transcript_21256:1521-2288(+)